MTTKDCATGQVDRLVERTGRSCSFEQAYGTEAVASLCLLARLLVRCWIEDKILGRHLLQ